MAKILKFESPRDSKARRDSRPAAGDRPSGGDKVACEVIIFPGVRVERQDFKLSDRLNNTAGGPGQGRKRRKNSGK